jgi:hypothetical protein
MPLSKILFKPGINRENTRYTTEGGWYEGDKVRFRQGTPEIIGGWARLSSSTFLGVCRSLWNWVTLTGQNLVGVGTNLKFYIEQGGLYNDITPVRATPTINNNPFALTASTTVTVTDTAHGATTGAFVTFSGAVDIGGGGTNVTAAVLNQEFEVTVINANSYTITISVVPNATALAGSPGGGASVVAAYQINPGPEFQIPLTGWGAGGWGLGGWGEGVPSVIAIRLWSQMNFGQNLIFGPRGGGIYYWDAVAGVGARGVNLTTLGDAYTPVVQNFLTVSDTSRFVIVFGTNDPTAVDPTALDPMLIRWSNQEDPFVWTPDATNQAGGIRLSHGSEIITSVQTRQEIVVFTDASVYSLQYLGPPYVWGSQLLGDNVSIAGPNAAIIASGVVYWMGVDKFYSYDGRVQTLNCDLRRYVFQDFNSNQSAQVYAGTNEGFNEVWWFYCSLNSTAIDRYVIYNYLENTWYYGSMSRTAWLDSGIRDYPMATSYDTGAGTGTIINHENGLNDNATGTPAAINAYISSSEFDIGDGHNFGFVWRVIPDLTFQNSTSAPNGDAATVTIQLYGLQNSGSGATDQASQPVAKLSTYNVTEEFTGQIYTRLRGRQMIFKIESNQLNTAWQLGAPRIDIRADGRR